MFKTVQDYPFDPFVISDEESEPNSVGSQLLSLYQLIIFEDQLSSN